MTLTEFLLARVEEEERVAHCASEHPPRPDKWFSIPGARIYDDTRIERGHTSSGLRVGEVMHPAVATHIALHDPARVFTDCQVKRGIVSLYERALVDIQTEKDAGGHSRADHAATASFALHDVLCSLALPYADHPDYQPEWRP